jgi:hypothetical protein
LPTTPALVVPRPRGGSHENAAATWSSYLAGLGAGKRWLGSYTTTFRFNEVIHYWALDGGWDCFENHYPSWKGRAPAEIVTWMSVAPALRDGWEDSILAALTPSPLQ